MCSLVSGKEGYPAQGVIPVLYLVSRSPSSNKEPWNSIDLCSSSNLIIETRVHPVRVVQKKGNKIPKERKRIKMQRRLASFFKPRVSKSTTVYGDNSSATYILPTNEQTLHVRQLSEETNLREPQTEEMVSTTISTDLSLNPYYNPCQPVLIDYPATTIGNRKWKFNSSYFLAYPWLIYSIKQDSVFCFNSGLAFFGHDKGESSAQGNFVETVYLLTEINPDLMKNSRKA